MRKVLVVDDDELVRDFLKLHFKNRGYEVATATDGKVAISLAEREKPDLIILDMNMLGMTGWDTAKELKREGAENATIPIIALTAHKTADDHVAAHEAGCDAFVEKPVEPERLFDTVDRALS